jgi:hypothetical protein
LEVEVINPGKKSYSKARSGILGQGVRVECRNVWEEVRIPKREVRIAWRKVKRPKPEAGKGVIEVYQVNKKTSIQGTWQIVMKSWQYHIPAQEISVQGQKISNQDQE